MIPTADRGGATRVPVQTEGHFPSITFPPSPILRPHPVSPPLYSGPYSIYLVWMPSWTLLPKPIDSA
jgi:hypothetical protein